ncbi:MAG: cation diffusion facilitator family transporter [Kiritimatiellae bacterium]|nr:cation diffusion facilitator family transporter [Kiritimatiellia bacterium]MDD3546451.1 cation diffusion facilitator family transporter [Kiritimatiellia bacterium]
MNDRNVTGHERTAAANRVTWLGFGVNLVLATFKMAAGIFGHSGAMVADAMHSFSDFATDIVVLVSFRLGSKPADDGHKYGHGKYETLAAAIIGGALLLAGSGILWSGAVTVWHSVRGEHPAAPGGIALAAAIVSIVFKEWLYRRTVAVGKRINSQTVVANAWHHRSDALSSGGALIGIGGAMVLGERWRVLDPLAALVLSLFIIKVALEILAVSIRELSEEALSDEVEAEIMRIAAACPGVSHPHNLRTRRIGPDIAVDIHVRVAADMRVDEAHAITSKIESEIRRRFGQTSFVSIHIEPEVYAV